MIDYLAGVLPGDARERLDSEGAKSSEHGPAAVDKLALAEALQAEHLRVGLEWSGFDIGGLEAGADDVTSKVLGQVLVQRVEVELQVLGRLPQAKGVEAVVADQRSVEPGRGHGSRVPQRAVRVHGRLAGLLGLRRLLAAEAEAGEEAAGGGDTGSGADVGQAGAQERGCRRRGRGRHLWLQADETPPYFSLPPAAATAATALVPVWGDRLYVLGGSRGRRWPMGL